MLLEARTNLRVRYAETDQMGIVYHSNYLVWFEIARTELFRGYNLPYTHFEKEGLTLAVIDINCRYRKPAYYDDLLTIVAHLTQISPRGAMFTYEVYREAELLAHGESKHIFLNKQGRPVSAKNFPIWATVKNILPLE